MPTKVLLLAISIWALAPAAATAKDTEGHRPVPADTGAVRADAGSLSETELSLSRSLQEVEMLFANSLREAELSFCRLVQDHGIRTAFLAVLDTEAIVFRPSPVNARNWYAARDSIAGILSWQPKLVVTSGDLGFTTGPWQFRRDSPDEEPVAFGDYVSVWRWVGSRPSVPPESREPGAPEPDSPESGYAEKFGANHDGWRLLLDLGVSHAGPYPSTGGTLPLLIPGRSQDEALKDTTLIRSPAAAARDAARSALLDADRALCAELATRAATDVFAEHTTPVSRLLREGHLPAIGTGQIRLLLADSTRLIAWTPCQAGISRSLDLGYTWGEVRVIHTDPAADTLSAHYLRTWRFEPRAGEWELVIECVPEQR